MRGAPALFVSVLAACSSGKAPRAIDGGVVVVRAPDAAPVEEVAAPPPDAGVAADPAERLRAGQALEQKQKWAEAIAALEQAASADDVAALQELAFAAVLAGDARRADAAVKRLLTGAPLDDARRATALYHLGRAAELRGDVPAARDAYQQSLALRGNATISNRVAHLGARPAPPQPLPSSCAKPMPTAELCGCLTAELGGDPALPMRCIESHHHSAEAWAVTVVSRDQDPTYLVSSPAKGQVQALAYLGAVARAVEGELTIRRWSLGRGPGGAPLVRIDARTSLRENGKLRTIREDALLCVVGPGARCLADLPLMERVGTPAVLRRLELTVDATDEHGVAQLTLVEGPPTPADLLGMHRLW